MLRLIWLAQEVVGGELGIDVFPEAAIGSQVRGGFTQLAAGGNIRNDTGQGPQTESTESTLIEPGLP